MPSVQQTERLHLRAIQETDVNEIWNCWMRDEEVSRYMWWKASEDISDAKRFVQFALDQIDNEKWCRWIIELKETAQIIGTCLVFFNEDDPVPHWDISYNLGKSFWGNGYMTEAMKEVMAFALERLGMRECITTYAKINTASANVLHKLGFKDIQEMPYACSNGEMITDGILCSYQVERD